MEGLLKDMEEQQKQKVGTGREGGCRGAQQMSQARAEGPLRFVAMDGMTVPRIRPCPIRVSSLRTDSYRRRAGVLCALLVVLPAKVYYTLLDHTFAGRRGGWAPWWREQPSRRPQPPAHLPGSGGDPGGTRLGGQAAGRGRQQQR